MGYIMIIENMKLNTVYHHNFNNAELASTRLMEDLSSKTTNGQFIRIAPNVFLYVSSEEGKCNLIAATPLHYFYSNLDTDNNDVESNDEGDVNSTKLDDNVNEDDDNEIENDSDDIDNETKDSSLHDSIDTDNSTCDDTDDLNTSVLIDNENNTAMNLNQNIDLAHNAIIDNNVDDIQQNPINSVNVLIPLSCNSNVLENESKDIENKIVNKYNGKVFRHNDLMFTHIRPDGIIDRVLTDESGHNCTSFK